MARTGAFAAFCFLVWWLVALFACSGFYEIASMKSCFRVGLFALPLPGAGVTFFAAAKKVTKESSFSQPKHFTPAAAQAIDLMARH